ncbi:hypothetical protein IBX73_06335 [candidate division WOR-3 bacterium]|nr:hypothetical protein [candidate division WOR-3 bacterium]
MKNLASAGRFLFRYRAAAATVAFVFLVLAARPVNSPAGHIFVLLGVVLRAWAAGYIGPAGRKREFQGEYVIKSGPYRLLRHPLYVGNFLLVLGVLVLFNPPFWLRALYLALFIVIYAVIICGETRYMKGKPAREPGYELSNLRGEFSTWIVLAVIYGAYFVLRALV